MYSVLYNSGPPQRPFGDQYLIIRFCGDVICCFEIIAAFTSLAAKCLFMTPFWGFVNLVLMYPGCTVIVSIKQFCYCFTDIRCFRFWPACLKSVRKQHTFPLELECLQRVLMRTFLHSFANRNRVESHFLLTILKLMDWFVIVVIVNICHWCVRLAVLFFLVFVSRDFDLGSNISCKESTVSPVWG